MRWHVKVLQQTQEGQLQEIELVLTECDACSCVLRADASISISSQERLCPRCYDERKNES